MFITLITVITHLLYLSLSLTMFITLCMGTPWSACHGGISILLPSRTGLGQRATEGYPSSSHHVLGLVSVPRRDIHHHPITYWAWSACHGGISTLLPSRTGLGQRATEGYPPSSHHVLGLVSVPRRDIHPPPITYWAWSACHGGISTLLPSRTGLGQRAREGYPPSSRHVLGLVSVPRRDIHPPPITYWAWSACP